VKHNQMDLRGLTALFGKINSLLDASENLYSEADSLDLFGLSKFLDRRGEQELAYSACARALGRGLPREFRPQATRHLALMAKRRGDGEQAAALWQELLAHPQDCVFASEQLAMHFERHAHDIARAIEFTELGIKKLQHKLACSHDPLWAARAVRVEKRLLCRLERLRHRNSKVQAATRAPLLAHSAAAASGSRQRSR